MVKKLIYFTLTFLVCSWLIVLTAHAADPVDTISLSDFLSSTNLSEKVITNALEQPETLNKELASSLIPNSQWKISKDLNLKFKTFITSDGSQSLGLSYNLSKDLNKYLLTDSSTTQTGISYSIDIEGNIVFNHKEDPNDFLNSNLSLHYFRSQGGVISVTDDLYTKLNQLEDQLVNIDNQNELLMSTEFKTFAETLRKNMSDQYYIDFSLIGGLESNRSFTNKEYYYGAQLGLDIKAWNPSSKLSKYNIFDWPFALIRFLSDNDDTLTVRGSSIPTVLIAVDLVDPQAGVVKELHSDKSVYTRFRVETSFRTPLSTKNNLTFFEASYRYYNQLNSSAMDKYQYFAEAIVLPDGMFVSYATGKLPLDLKNDHVYELGFKFNL